MTMDRKQGLWLLYGVVMLGASGCGSMKTPATAEVAVSKAAVDNAAGAGASEFAPVEMRSAREKLARANQAMAAKDYALASDRHSWKAGCKNERKAALRFKEWERQ